MAKALKKVGKVLAIAAAVSTVAFGPANPITLALSAAATVTNIGAGFLAKPPPAQGSVSQLIIDPDAPQPYIMGGMYFAGVLRHRAGYGGTVDGIPNPYLGEVVCYSGCGPVESISPRVDFDTVTSWYTGFLYTDTQLGATPESTALTPNWSGMTGWGSSDKLSGYAAILWNFKFDKAGKKFASGRPNTGAYVEGVKVYDPRLDSTFPGGSGSCRLGDESTYVYSTRPALHAGTYAYGRYQNDIRVFGIGIPADGIDWQVVADWANVCDTNGWNIAGIIFEPGDRGQNLIDICAAGGGEPIFGATLSFKYAAPVVALDTITEADIADEDMSVVAMQGYTDRVNTVVPKYRSALHNWELVAAEPVVNSTTLTEDGEERRVEWPFNFVKDKDQAAELAAYRLVDSREFYPIELTVSPRFRSYRPGDCLELDLPQLGLETDAVIITREVDPATMKVRLTLRGETPAKHDFALGRTGVAPATPALGQTAEERDEISASSLTVSDAMTQIRSSAIVNPRTALDVSRRLLRAFDLAGDIIVDVAKHDCDYPGLGIVTRALDEIDMLDDGVTPLPDNTLLAVYFDDDTLSDTAPTYKATTDLTAALNSAANPGRHAIGVIQTPAFGGATNQADVGIGYKFS